MKAAAAHAPLRAPDGTGTVDVEQGARVHIAIAGGHMSMRTFLLLVFAEKTALDYWGKTIVNWGMYYTRDDLFGRCKFAGIGVEKNRASQVNSPPIPCLHHAAETGGL